MLSAAMGLGQDGDLNKRQKLHATPCIRSSPPAHQQGREEEVYPATIVFRRPLFVGFCSD